MFFYIKLLYKNNHERRSFQNEKWMSPNKNHGYTFVYYFFKLSLNEKFSVIFLDSNKSRQGASHPFAMQFNRIGNTES